MTEDKISLEKRTQEDQARVKAAIARASRPDDSDNKDPDGEAENPAPMQEGHRSQDKPKHHDLQGQQGGQKGGAKEPI
jgi:hypothetical protein